jgi:NADH oxidase (H2O2-forming)
MRFVVVGNGIAGNTAADKIREMDREAEITIISDQAHSFYSACALPHYLAGDLGKRGVFIKTREDYRENGVRVLLGRRVVSISTGEKKVILEAASIDYDRLLLATGSRPLVPPIEGIGLPGVSTFKYLDDAVRIAKKVPETAAVIGSGPIGIEAATALRKRGAKVYIIELMGRIMPRLFDDRPALMLSEILSGHGIKVLTGERVISIVGSAKVEGITTDKRTIGCDLIVMAAGMRPNSEIAKQSGVAVASRGGIIVDRHMQTNVVDVYACGDCVEAADLITGGPSMIQLWHNAKEEAEVAASNAVGVRRRYAGSINITSLDVFGNHAVSFGNTEADLAAQEGVEIVEKPHGERGYHRLVLKDGRVVGAQFVGDLEDMGAVLYTLIRKDRLDELVEFGQGRPATSILQQNYRFARFLSARRQAQQA